MLQVPVLSLIHILILPIGLNGIIIYFINANLQSRVDFLSLELFFCIIFSIYFISVSYTHLDVYKRQI